MWNMPSQQYIILTAPAASPRSLFQHLELDVHVYIKQDLTVDDISLTALKFAALNGGSSSNNAN